MKLSLRVCGIVCVLAVGAVLSARGAVAPTVARAGSVLDDNILVTWYGNPHSNRMGILGERKGDDLANGLKAQAAEYQKLTTKHVMIAYHLVTVVAQAAPGADGK